MQQYQPCPLCEMHGSFWWWAQALRVAQLVIAAGIFGASFLGIAFAQTRATETITERVRAVEVQVQVAQTANSILTPRVDKLEQELGKLYGIGIAVGVILGLINAGKLFVAVRRPAPVPIHTARA